MPYLLMHGIPPRTTNMKVFKLHDIVIASPMTACTYRTCKAIEQMLIPTKYTDLDDGVDKYKMESWPVMDPHSIAHFLFEFAGLKIPTGSLREYWEFNSEHGEHWAQGVPSDTVPLGVYGDGARVNTKFGSINLIGIYFNIPLWKPQSVRASRFLVAVLPEEKCWRHHTLNTILRRVTWSLNSLMDGFHPRNEPFGEDLPKHLAQLAGKQFKYKCMLTEIRGDWQWHKRTFRFWQCSWNGKKVCYWCRALSQSNDPSDLYWSFENNNWDASHFTKGEFLEERMPPAGICFLDFDVFFSLYHFGDICCFWDLSIISCWFITKVLILGFEISTQA